jgi:processive 1,2-diacylglycerol beta-glucosyltransferase
MQRSEDRQSPHMPSDRFQVSVCWRRDGPIGACEHLRLWGPFTHLERDQQGWGQLDYALKHGTASQRLLRRLRRATDHLAPGIGGSPVVQTLLAGAPRGWVLAPPEKTDALLIFRETSIPEYGEQVFLEARRRGIPVVYDTDDLLIDVPDHLPVAERYRPMRSLLRRWIQQADHLTVSTHALADELADLNRSISVTPNFIDRDLWGVSPVSPPGEGPTTIAYWGSAGHRTELQRLTTVFRHLKQRYGQRVRFHFMGCHDPEMLALEDVIVGAHVESYAAYAAATRCHPIDIGLAPLADNRFNRCKSAIKFFEYSIRGACGVYADLTPYQQVVRSGENGVLVGPALEEWVGALEQLIEAPERRVRLARQAQADVLHHHTLEKQSVHWRNAYQLAVAPFARPRESVAVMA